MADDIVGRFTLCVDTPGRYRRIAKVKELIQRYRLSGQSLSCMDYFSRADTLNFFHWSSHRKQRLDSGQREGGQWFSWPTSVSLIHTPQADLVPFLHPKEILPHLVCFFYSYAVPSLMSMWRGCDSCSAQPTNYLKWREHDGCWHSSPTKVSKGRTL